VVPIENPKSKIQNLKAALEERGLAPRKSLGQNFMVDPNFAAAVARAAEPDQRTLVLEVGPGTGCLTEALLATHPAARVLAMELDRGLAAYLRETFAELIARNRLTLLEGDALAGKHALAPELVKTALQISAQENRPRRVLCANLPYNAATPILMNLAADAACLGVESAIATIQTELAERLLSPPDQHAYGAPSAFLGLRATGKILRRIGNEVFWPRPQVDSAVIRLDFKPWPAVVSPLLRGRCRSSPDEQQSGSVNPQSAIPNLQLQEAAPFQQFLQTLFSHRRKTIRAVLKLRELPPELQLSPTARAEELAPAVLLALFRLTAERPPESSSQ
jgi:16S rRNA (adenine1518-N6/adenine1519-N6)-dimethyltransferase